MSVTTDILSSYRKPGGVIRKWLAAGRREDRALAVLMLAVVLIFLSRIPVVRRGEILGAGGAVPAEGQLAGYLMGTVFLFPLAAFGIAALSRGVAALFGGTGTHFGARVALFWALLAVSPLLLVEGLARGLAGDGMATGALGVVVFALFLWVWIGGLVASERHGHAA